MKITWGHREVRNPLARGVIMLFLPAVMVVMFTVGIVVLAIGIALSFPVHLVLLICGRKGFATRGPGGLSYNAFSRRGFERRA